MKLNVGLIGLGRLGKVYARDLSSRLAETRLAAVADVNASLAAEVASEFEVPNSYADARDLRWRHRLVTSAERAVRRRRVPADGIEANRVTRAAGPTGCNDHARARQVVEVYSRREAQRGYRLWEEARAGEQRGVNRRRERAAVGGPRLVELEVWSQRAVRDLVRDGLDHFPESRPPWCLPTGTSASGPGEEMDPWLGPRCPSRGSCRRDRV